MIHLRYYLQQIYLDLFTDEIKIYFSYITTNERSIITCINKSKFIT